MLVVQSHWPFFNWRLFFGSWDFVWFWRLGADWLTAAGSARLNQRREHVHFWIRTKLKNRCAQIRGESGLLGNSVQKNVICYRTIDIFVAAFVYLPDEPNGWSVQQHRNVNGHGPTRPAPPGSQQLMQTVPLDFSNMYLRSPVSSLSLTTVFLFAVSNHGLPEHGPGGTSRFYHSRSEGQRERRQRSQRFGVQTVSPS